MTASERVNREIAIFSGLPDVEEQGDPLFWCAEQMVTYERDLPTIFRLQQQYLSIPASSADSERMFSIAGKLFGMDRSALDPLQMEKMLLIAVTDIWSQYDLQIDQDGQKLDNVEKWLGLI